MITALVLGPTVFLALTRETRGTLVLKYEPLRAPLSRVGSGANGYSSPSDLAPAPQRQVPPRRLRAVPEEESDPHAAPTCRGCLPVETDPSSVHNHHALIGLITEIVLLFALFSFLILMYHGHHEIPHGIQQLSSASFSHRVPPRWSPEDELQYPLSVIYDRPVIMARAY